MSVGGLDHRYVSLKELDHASYAFYKLDMPDCYYPGFAEVVKGMSKAKTDRRVRLRMIMECDNFFTPRDPDRAWGEVYIEVAEVVPELDGKGFMVPALFRLGFFNPPCGTCYNHEPRYDPEWGASKLKEAADMLAKHGFSVETGPLPS